MTKFSSSPKRVVEVLGSKFRGQNLKNQVFTLPVAICNSWPITRNITRWLFLHVNHWFIWVFDEPGFLLIRRSLVRAQVEEPPKKAVSKAGLFLFNVTMCHAEGLWVTFCPQISSSYCTYITRSMSAVKRFSSQPEHHRSDIVSSCTVSYTHLTLPTIYSV